jgi:hypothetical protein
MTIEETKQILTILSARYVGAKLWDQDPALTIRVWHMSLDDVPFPAAERVLVMWFRDEKWPPDPSELRDRAFGLLATCQSREEREALEPGWTAANERWFPENRALREASGLRAIG